VFRYAHAMIPFTALGLVLVACGGGTESAGTQPATADTATDAAAPSGAGCDNSEVVALIEEAKDLEGQEREDFLIERAVEAGGDISLYTEMSDSEEVLDAFEDRYDDSGLELSIYRAGSEQVRQRILEEAAVGFSGADLLEIEALEMVILGEEGILAPSSSPWADDVVEAGQFEHFTADRFSYILPLWNTDLVDAAPQSLEDFASDKYAGQMALEDSDVYWFAVIVKHLTEEQGLSKDEAVDLFKQIAANSTITHGHTTTAELVVAGQHGITPNAYLHRAMKFEGKGAPVGWNPVNVPVVAEITAVSVLCTAANPAGALLLQDFFLDPDGAQAVFVEVGRTPANREAQAEQLGEVDIDPIRGDVAEIVAEYAEWAELWDEVIRGQGG
jgi:iron(III) transport system substrate-binding protein